MKFYSRRLVMPEHLNSANRLFGGKLLSWIDEEAFIGKGYRGPTDIHHG